MITALYYPIAYPDVEQAYTSPLEAKLIEHIKDGTSSAWRGLVSPAL